MTLLCLSIEQALADADPLVQALAMSDAWLGRRRLEALDAAARHPLVAAMLRVRWQAEGIVVPTARDA